MCTRVNGAGKGNTRVHAIAWHSISMEIQDTCKKKMFTIAEKNFSTFRHILIVLCNGSLTVIATYRALLLRFLESLLLLFFVRFFLLFFYVHRVENVKRIVARKGCESFGDVTQAT